MAKLVQLFMECPICRGTGGNHNDQGSFLGDCYRCGGTGREPWGTMIYPKVSETSVLLLTYLILSATDISEYIVLTASQKIIYDLIISSGHVDFSEESVIRTQLLSMFGEGTTTRTNLLAL